MPKIIITTIIPFIAEIIDVGLDPSCKQQCHNAKDYIMFILKQEPSPSSLLPLIIAINNAFIRYIDILYIPYIPVPCPYSKYHINQYNQASSCFENLSIFKDIISSSVSSIMVLKVLKPYCQEIKKYDASSSNDDKYTDGLPHVLNAMIRLCKAYCNLAENDTNIKLLTLINSSSNNNHRELLMNIVNHVISV